MAADFYLRLEGYKGESTDSAHVDWMEISNLSWSINQPRSATSSTGGGHTAERVELSDICFVKEIDTSSPQLMQLCAMGKTIPNAKIEIFRADGEKPIKYFEVELENVLIGSIAPNFAGGGAPTESVALKFSKITWKYTKQKIGGGAMGNTQGSWNLATNQTK